MGDKLSSLAFALLAFVGGGYYLIEGMGLDPATIIPVFGLIFLVWFVFWLTWAFRWVVVFAPVVICYALFAFYEQERELVYGGAVASGVLFVLTGIQHAVINRKRRAIEKQEDREFERLRKRRESRR